ncbi:MAG TPA: amino acid deaminase/aldolase [Solirubrobacteraceae bacterium]|nr:amino acid deaminase/aldolase [Solirubrobacteraceae bacterium]
MDRLDRATADLDPPFALLDLDALWANAADMERRAAGKPMRLASKSLRCREVQRRVLERPGWTGTLAFTLPEALWLAEEGWDDLVVAYPTVDRAALRRLATGPARERVTVMVDSVAPLHLIGSVAGAGSVRVCIDVDAGWAPLGGRVRIGAKRSPVRTPDAAAALAREIAARPEVELDGVMAYEAQIAGVGDRPPGRPVRGLALRAIQRLSARELAARRGAVVEAVGAVAPLRFVNGGGTGSLHTTTREPAVTEIAAGSGLYGPTLFDAYRAFAPRPAALFALPVVRKPARSIATALGGGYLASGPADAARLPRPFRPEGLRLDPQEGAGEVQTPLLGGPARDLAVGDRVWFRHAKAGELCERFDRLYLVEGDAVVEELPTYRGEGRTFL